MPSLARPLPLPGGITLALFGALVLTPDALFMRLSGMDGFQMLGWRGMCMGAIFLVAWWLSSPARGRDLAAMGTGAAAVIIVCQYFNALLFPLGIGSAPVAPVLIGVATVPVWSALLSRLLHDEPTSRATWVAIVAVLSGLVLAITDKGEAAADPRAALGLACGLGVAFALALNFVTLRHNPTLPLLLAIGIGAVLASATGWVVTGPGAMTDGRVWAILVTGIVILPIAFFSLSQASRHTAAANVSLLLLLETVLAPLWVWLALSEQPGARTVAGGAIVVLSLALYLGYERRRARA